MSGKLIVLGIGNATVTKCYNTCFCLQCGENYLLVDAGGGNGILSQLEKANISLNKIRNMFVTHAHTDHILGVVWIIRIIASLIYSGNYSGAFNIYCHSQLKETIVTLCKLTIQSKFTNLIGDKILINIVGDGQSVELPGMTLTFFDIHSTKAMQYGFTAKIISKTLTCLGDEPYRATSLPYCENVDCC